MTWTKSTSPVKGAEQWSVAYSERADKTYLKNVVLSFEWRNCGVWEIFDKISPARCVTMLQTLGLSAVDINGVNFCNSILTFVRVEELLLEKLKHSPCFCQYPNIVILVLNGFKTHWEKPAVQRTAGDFVSHVQRAVQICPTCYANYRVYKHSLNLAGTDGAFGQFLGESDSERILQNLHKCCADITIDTTALGGNNSDDSGKIKPTKIKARKWYPIVSEVLSSPRVLLSGTNVAEIRSVFAMLINQLAIHAAERTSGIGNWTIFLAKILKNVDEKLEKGDEVC